MTPKRLAIGSAVALVLGIIAAAAGGSTIDAIALTVGGLGAVGLTSALFWAIGQSEDRERERDRERRP
jgi:hypothetical protein